MKVITPYVNYRSVLLIFSNKKKTRFYEREDKASPMCRVRTEDQKSVKYFSKRA